MMPIHNLKARSLTDYNKDLGLGIKVGAKYGAHIRAGLTQCTCLLHWVIEDPIRHLPNPTGIFSSFIYDLVRPGPALRHSFALQTRVTRCPKQVSRCCCPLRMPGWAPQWLISLGFNLGLLAFSLSRAFFLLQQWLWWLWFPKLPSTGWEPTILWFLFRTWLKL